MSYDLYNKSIVLATSNRGKINEFAAMLSPCHFIVQSDLNINSASETGHTFIENALLKARHASDIAKMPAIADDSGLVVPILKGKPGIYSSRFAGNQASDQNNMDYLLAQLNNLPLGNARPDAFFYCAIVLIKHADDPAPLVGLGRLDGEITFTPEGKHGFGYDPIFYLPTYQCTMAELTLEEKNSISHRAKALKALKVQIDYN